VGFRISGLESAEKGLEGEEIVDADLRGALRCTPSHQSRYPRAKRFLDAEARRGGGSRRTRPWVSTAESLSR
jgi:hypothetical protein